MEIHFRTYTRKFITEVGKDFLAALAEAWLQEEEVCLDDILDAFEYGVVLEYASRAYDKVADDDCAVVDLFTTSELSFLKGSRLREIAEEEAWDASCRTPAPSWLEPEEEEAWEKTEAARHWYDGTSIGCEPDPGNIYAWGYGDVWGGGKDDLVDVALDCYYGPACITFDRTPVLDQAAYAGQLAMKLSLCSSELERFF